MANVRRPGFRWYHGRYQSGSPPIIRVPVATAYQGAINGGSNIDIVKGTPVRRLDSGYWEIADGSEGGSGGEAIGGIMVGVDQYYDGSVIRKGSRVPGGTAYSTILDRTTWILVIPANAGLFEVDADAALATPTEAGARALVGSNGDHRHLTGDEPNPDTFLDISDVEAKDASAATAQWRVEFISDTQENQDFTGAYVKFVVSCNEAQQPPYDVTGF